MEKKIRIGIVDDELAAVTLIKQGVEQEFEKHCVAVHPDTFFSARELLTKMDTLTYDLVFLDISMPSMDGILLGERIMSLGNGTQMVYVSSRTDRMYDAFSVRPFGFVRKANFNQDLEEVVNRFFDEKNRMEREDFVAIQGKTGISTLLPGTLVYVENCRNYQVLHLESGDTRKVYSRMEILTEKLKDYNFIRIHKGFLVNMNFVRQLGSKNVVLMDETELPVGRSFQGNAREQYLEFIRNSWVVL